MNNTFDSESVLRGRIWRERLLSRIIKVTLSGIKIHLFLHVWFEVGLRLVPPSLCLVQSHPSGCGHEQALPASGPSRK